MKKAVIYARVSTARQADDGVSIEAQIEHCERKALEMDAAVLQVFRDDGVTGTSATKRHAFQRAINFCAYNDVDYFIVWSTSRFARNKIDAASYKQLLKESGVRLVYASMSLNSDTDEGWFTESLLEIMDEHYSRQVSKDTKRSMMKNAEDGFFNGGRAPFGYEIVKVGKRKKLVPSESEKGLMQQIFKRFATGESAVTICRGLNKSGITCRGLEFQAASLSRALKNQIYRGVTIFNKTTHRKANPENEWIIKETHEAIISQDVFEAVQLRFSPRFKALGSPKSNFYFTGLIRCGCCKTAMVIETGTSKSKRMYSYYNCGRFRKGYSCLSRRISADKFDQYLLAMVVDKLLTQEMAKEFFTEAYKIHMEKNSERLVRLNYVKSELVDLRRKRQTLMTILEEQGATEIKSLLHRVRDHDERELVLLEEEAKILAQPIYSEPNEVELQAAVEMLRKITLNNKNVKKMRILLQSFIESIDVLDDEIIVNYIPDRIVSEKKSVLSFEQSACSSRYEAQSEVGCTNT